MGRTDKDNGIFFFFFISPPSLPGRWKYSKFDCECVCPLCLEPGVGQGAAGRAVKRSEPAIFPGDMHMNTWVTFAT